MTQRTVDTKAGAARGRFGIAAVCLAVLAIGVAIAGPWGPRMLDLRVYQVGAEALLSGGDIYHASEPETGLPFTYPVFAALMFTPFVVLPTLVGRIVMLAACLAALYAIWHVAIRRGLGWDRPRTNRWCPTAAILSIALHPVLDTIIFGQVNLILLAMILIDLLVIRDSRRGYLVGLAAGIKVTPTLFILYLLVTGQYRAARNAAATMAATVAIGFAIQPAAAWAFWTRYAMDPARTGNVTYAGNQSLLATAIRLTRDIDLPRPLVTGVCVLVAVVVLALARRLYRDGQALLAVCSVGVATLLVSPISWTHHWVWAIPCLVVVTAAVVERAAGWSRRRRTTIVALVVAAAAIVATGPMRFVPTNELRELHHNLFEQIVANSYALLAVGFLVWAGSQSRRRPGADTVPVRPRTPDLDDAHPPRPPEPVSRSSREAAATRQIEVNCHAALLDCCGGQPTWRVRPSQ